MRKYLTKKFGYMNLGRGALNLKLAADIEFKTDHICVLKEQRARYKELNKNLIPWLYRGSTFLERLCDCQSFMSKYLAKKLNRSKPVKKQVSYINRKRYVPLEIL